MIHFRHLQTFPKIPKMGQKFQSRDKVLKSESTEEVTTIHEKFPATAASRA